MKAVFPCKGVVVLTKKDIKSLENFYNNKLSSTKTPESFNTSKSTLKIGNLYYLPSQTNIVINEENLLSLLQLRSMMENSVVQTSSSDKKINDKNLQKPISDNDILSHPFFTTLKPLY